MSVGLALCVTMIVAGRPASADEAPVYKGKTLMQWVIELGEQNHDLAEAYKAAEVLGPRSAKDVPQLMEYGAIYRYSATRRYGWRKIMQVTASNDLILCRYDQARQHLRRS